MGEWEDGVGEDKGGEKGVGEQAGGWMGRTMKRGREVEWRKTGRMKFGREGD